MRSLLNLQEKDMERLGAEAQLKRFPSEIEELRKKIKGIQEEDAGLKGELKELEVKRKDTDLLLQEAENKITSLKTKQMEVKKNEEYQALEKEIATQEGKVSQLEDQELMVMEEIDNKEKEYKKKQAEFGERVAGLEGQVKHLEKQEEEVKGRIERLREAAKEAAKDVDRVYLSKYEQVVKHLKKGPFVVPLLHGRCEGCHLKVSNEVVGGAKHGEEIQQCDSCSRIVYWVER